MSEPFDDVIVSFEDSVPAEEIDKYVEELVSAGGELKRDWYRKGGINAFAARIPVSCLETFKSLTGSGTIKSIEPDGIVTIQEIKESEPSESVSKPNPTDDAIVVFEDSVSTEEIEKYVKELELAGGKVKYHWYRDEKGVKGFAAKIPESCLHVFSSLQSTGKIKHIEADGIVTTQTNLATQAA